MTARIFKPAKNAMQSGKATTKEWQLDYEPEKPRVVEPLMGWTSSADMKQQLTLHFHTRDEAVAYCEANGIAYCGWRDGGLVAVVDWDHAGRGAAGLDLASARFDAAFLYGQGAEDAVLAGWEAEAGRPCPDLAYWDVTAAVATPPDLAWFVPTTIADTGRDDLDRPTMIARRDAFLEDALERLAHSSD